MCCIKVCKNGTIAGHLPRDVSRPTKFILDCGAIVQPQLNDYHYLKSPLLQEGLEIPCFVTHTLSGTIRNHMALGRFKELVKYLYCELANEIIVGNFLEVAILTVVQTLKRKEKKSSATAKC